MEENFAPSIFTDLTNRGHQIEKLGKPLGGSQCIWINHENGVLIGGSEPRKDGCAMGY